MSETLRHVRVAVKDNIDVAGLPTGLGNPDWAASHAAVARDATAVASLRRAGATIVGKFQTDEFAYSLAGDNAHFDALENPAAPGHMVGGSSSGPAAAVAAGLADLGLGTDTAGSIRVPASYCGLYGLRPTWGRVSTDGVAPLARSFDTVGLLARDARTLRAGFEALTGELPRTGAPGARAVLVEARLPSLTAAVTETAVERVLSALGATRHRTVDLEAAIGEEWVDAFSVVQGAEFWTAHGDWIAEHRPALTGPVADRVAFAAGIDADQHAAARQRLAVVRLRVRTLVGGEFLVMPTTPSPAPLRGEASPSLRREILRLTTLASISGLPAISVPAPADGHAPLGVSILGPANAEARLLAAAGAWELARRT